MGSEMCIRDRIRGVVSLVVVSAVVNVGAAGAVVSTVMLSALDTDEVFP